MTIAMAGVCPDPESDKWGGHVPGCYGPKDPRHTGKSLRVAAQSRCGGTVLYTVSEARAAQKEAERRGLTA